MSSSCRDLQIWQKAMDLATSIYQYTENFPKSEVYGLTSQLRRAGVSVASNMAEGNGRSSKQEFSHFLSIARGSILEIETQIGIALRIGYLADIKYNKLLSQTEELKKMLYVFNKKLVA